MADDSENPMKEVVQDLVASMKATRAVEQKILGDISDYLDPIKDAVNKTIQQSAPDEAIAKARTELMEQQMANTKKTMDAMFNRVDALLSPPDDSKKSDKE